MNNERNIFDSLQEEIMQSELPDDEKNRRLSALLKASGRRVNLLLVGASGAGKSSTINAMFDMSVAKVGVGVDPETKEIAKFDLGNLTIWDTPGLGDGVKADKAHIKQIVRKLSESGEDGNLLIDLVLVVLDAGSKDLAVSYDVINNTLIPCLGPETHRILIGLNQCDLAMKGRHWDHERNEPDSVLKGFLAEKAHSVKRRIQEATGVTADPVWYCAGYTEEDGERRNPYNLSKLLYCVLMAVPSEKRLVLADKLNTDERNWVSNDGDYFGAVQESFWDSLLKYVLEGIEQGAIIGGCVIGVPGMFVGGLVGAVVGGLKSLVVKPLSKLRPQKALVPLSNFFKH
jgi:predicted GTPase